ncbi:tellurite resistance [Caulobacter phage CcrBL9]|uniref:Tellurite resistance protein n=1 Tax=Caulobacter phage CcrBL9 TaxID=2283270 RepID=A0A385EC70_9CAUD|nr:tellurite resistance [Caulobacter phage CcrBL9]AXQ69276.1 tellurite resistance protein [Caulobacter phage CcrBL9]
MTSPVNQAVVPAAPAYVPASGRAFTLSEIGSLGAGEMSRATTISDKVTGIAKAQDMDDLGKGLLTLLDTARQYDPSKWNKGPFGFLKRWGSKQIDAHVSSVNDNVDKLVNQVQSQIGLFERRIGDITGLEEENKKLYDALGQVVIAANERIAWAEANVPAVDPNDPTSAQAVSNWNDAIAFAKKKVDDLERTRTLCLLQGPQLAQVKNNSFLLTEKFKDLKANTLPAMKRQFALYIIQMEQKKGAELANNIDDAFNEAIVKNADLTRQNTVAIGNAMARSSVDMASLQAVTASVVGAIDDMAKIRSDMAARLTAEAPQIAALTSQVSTALARTH